MRNLLYWKIFEPASRSVQIFLTRALVWVFGGSNIRKSLKGATAFSIKVGINNRGVEYMATNVPMARKLIKEKYSEKEVANKLRKH